MPGGWICTRNITFDLIGGTDSTLHHTPPKPLAVVKNRVNEILQRYCPAMRTLVAEAGRKPLISPWIPKIGSGGTEDTAFRNHIEMLAIPAVNGRPSLLLHDLGSETSAIGKKQAEYIPGVFLLDRHKCVHNYNSLRLDN
jgi:hypothetical protein